MALFRMWLQVALSLFIGQQAFAACDLSSLNGNTSGRTDILVVINENSPASCQVGTYYALQRGLGPAQVALVKTPISPHISWQQTQILRDQLIKRMAELAAARGHAVANCGGAAPYYCQSLLDHIAQHSGIRYIVMTKGIAARARTGGDPTSVDGQLRHLLANFSESPLIWAPHQFKRLFAFGDGLGMRIVEPSVDKEYIVGRIDGLTVAAAKALVDRSLQAESEGIFGKAYYDSLVEGDGPASPLDRLIESGTVATVNEFRVLWNAITEAKSPRYDFSYRLLGIFDESRPECSAIRSPQIYLSKSAGSAAGKSPTHCHARLQHTAERIAQPTSRHPQPSDALVYAGEQDGQPAAPGRFSQLLNWRKNGTCSQTLCTPGDQVCKNASTDAFKEIDTRCVGVADGFMGHNMQSYPMSYLWAWPTAWAPMTGTWRLGDNEFNNTGWGDHPNIAYPWVRTDEGEGDSHSLWFGEAVEPLLGDPNSPASCHVDQGLTNTDVCRNIAGEQHHRLEFQQLISFAGTSEQQRSASNTTPRDYLLSFDVQVRGSSNSSIALRPSLLVHAVGGGETLYDQRAGMETNQNQSSSFSISTQNTWQHRQVVLRLSPAQVAASGWNGSYDGIGVRFVTTGSSALFSGQLGLDNVSLKEIGKPDEELIQNGNFQDGHRTVVTGDHAAVYLSRLNGIGFWGSVGHFALGGHSFGDVLGTFTYFWRGLPLGDAVWHEGDDTNGIFYGDPVYSPIKIRLNPVYTRTPNAPSLRVGDIVQLRASTVNGSATTSTYTTAYCRSSTPSFYGCDQYDQWISLPMSGAGGSVDQLIGNFGSQVNHGGWYILRLSVQTTNANLQRQQTFNDYAFLYYTDGMGDFDNDAIPDAIEACGATNYAIKDSPIPPILPGSACLQDSDGDGVNNLLEILRSSDPDNPASVNTNSASDYDRDGVSDELEFVIGSHVLSYDQDSDGDKRSNAAEIRAGTDPMDADSFKVYQIPPPLYQRMVE